jgi:hypothetical protein
VLPRQPVELLVDDEAVRAELLLHLRLAHLVQQLDRDFGILEPELDQHDAPVRLQRPLQRREHRFGMGELVVDVDEEGEVDGLVGQLRVHGRSEQRDDGRRGSRRRRPLRLGALLRLLREEREHLGLHVDRVDRTLRPDELREPERVEAVAAADVGDALPFLQLQRGEQLAAALFFLARDPREPRSGLVGHDRRDPAAHVFGERRRQRRLLRVRGRRVRLDRADPGGEAEQRDEEQRAHQRLERKPLSRSRKRSPSP